MLVPCGNPNCYIQYADSLRACPVCSTPKPDRSAAVVAKPDPGGGVNMMGIRYSTLAFSSLLGLVKAAVAANFFAIAIGAVMTFVWGRLAVTAFEEKSVK